MLETIWFILWGVLWTVYFVLDGFDLGLGTLLPFITRSEDERRVVINSMGPFWDGNEVWLITAGGVTFAAFPKTYAIMFSSLYTPLMMLLFALIIRGISFEFRGKVESATWRKIWDTALCFGSFLPSLLLGVAFTNIFMGIPINGDGVLEGNLFTLLNPYGLLGGILFVVFFVMHGALWLTMKSEGELQQRALQLTRILWPIELVLAATFLVTSKFTTDLYSNYLEMPWMWILPFLAVTGLVGIRWFLAKAAYTLAWTSSALTIAGATLWGVAGLFPNLLPSSLSPAFSQTAFNSASSPLTLKIMLGVAGVMVPIVIGYQAWVYKRFSGKVRIEELFQGESY